MSFFRTSSIVAGMLLIFTLFGIRSIHARDEQTVSKSIEAATAVPAIQSAETVTASPAVTEKKKIVVKRKKSRKKSAAKKTIAPVAETSPGEKLTINQVVDILKTTRDLSGKNLSGLYLVGINLSKCNLKGVDLSHANLERADLGESDLERAELTGANLKMANLRLSGLIGANLERAIFDGAVWKDGRVCATGSVGQCRELVPPSFGK